MLDVSQQSVQKWESGESVPELKKIVNISEYFGVSLDALILENDNRVVEEMYAKNEIKPQYVNIHDWEFYSSNLMTEYQQSIEEGLDIVGEYEGCIFHRMVIDQIIEFRSVMFGVCVERFDRMGVNTDYGGIG